MKRIIDITKDNRDLYYNKGYKLWFEDEGDNLYTIHCNLDYILKYAGVNYDELPEDATEYDMLYTDQNGIGHKCKNISFDPAGGPYISVGNYMIEGKTVTRIFNKEGETYFKVSDDK